MPVVVPVRLRYSRSDIWCDPASFSLSRFDFVIVKTARGLEFGTVSHEGFEAPEEEIGDTPLNTIERIATNEDVEKANDQLQRGDDALAIFRRLTKEHELDIKPVGVDFIHEGNKAVCYFSADQRIDFRAIVRDLARELKSRIDMRQINARESSGVIGAIGCCGQELCCARMGKIPDHITVRMARDQNMSANSTRVSGMCGRLMCCLAYEHDVYVDFKKRAPKNGTQIETPFGTAVVAELFTTREEVGLKLDDGVVMVVPLSTMSLKTPDGEYISYQRLQGEAGFIAQLADEGESTDTEVHEPTEVKAPKTDEAPEITAVLESPENPEVTTASEISEAFETQVTSEVQQTGCNCSCPHKKEPVRPNAITREALETIEKPEIARIIAQYDAAALAQELKELEQQSFELRSRDARQSKSRRRSRGEQESSERSASDATNKTSRRRRSPQDRRLQSVSSSVSSSTERAENKQSRQAAEDGSGSRRSRRSRKRSSRSEKQANQGQVQAQKQAQEQSTRSQQRSGEQSTSRRSRQRRSGSGSSQEHSPQAQQALSQDKLQAKPRGEVRRRRRRPGDGGGIA